MLEKYFFEGYAWLGVQLLDYQDIYFHYTYNKLPNATLEAVSQAEIGEGKVNYANFNSMEDMYVGNWKKYIPYEEDELNDVYNKIKETSGEEQEKYIKEFEQMSYNKFVEYGIVDIELILKNRQKRLNILVQFKMLHIKQVLIWRMY